MDEPVDPFLAEPSPLENVWTTSTGQVIYNVHSPAQCEGRGCCIHHPSDHHMKDWPITFRGAGPFDIGPPFMERLCKHGVGHPDPDDVVYYLSRGVNVGVHGCCGCCRSPE
jgi:hypothetical protein